MCDTCDLYLSFHLLIESRKEWKVNIWICMEYIPNFSLYDLIHRTMENLTEREVQIKNDRLTLTPNEITAATCQILKGISLLHSTGFVHGDIKCSNALVTMEGQVRHNDRKMSELKLFR